jgi:hypothetical protein
VATETSARKQSANPVPIYIVGAVVVLGAALFVYLRFFATAPAQNLPLTQEAKSYIRNLDLSDVEIKATDSYLQQRIVEIDGKIGNKGDRNLEVVELYCVFYDRYGQLVLRKRVPIVSQRMGGLKPGETKSFRLPFDEIPDSWNQQMPQLVIAGMKFS